MVLSLADQLKELQNTRDILEKKLTQEETRGDAAETRAEKSEKTLANVQNENQSLRKQLKLSLQKTTMMEQNIQKALKKDKDSKVMINAQILERYNFYFR